ncbi:MAG TPA: CoA protein activase [Clostridia bacterium]|nr:CoA protein activase [Clostridia bacterium]
MMKIAFPIMGTSYIAFQKIMEKLGHEAIVPPKPSKRTLSLGVTYSPEFACLPFKILLGSYLEAIERGADTIVSYGGVGPCRAGYYGVMHEKIIRDLGYDVKFIIFEPPHREFKKCMAAGKELVNAKENSWGKIFEALTTGWVHLRALDEIERLSHEIRPYEINKGDTTKAFKQCLELMKQADTKKQIAEAKRESVKILKNVEVDPTRNPLKIGLIGEIYVVIEPFANFDIQVTLGEMGVLTRRNIYITDWTKDNTFFKGEEHIKRAARPYLNQMIGGHGIISVGQTVLYAKEGYDGVVQLAPFSCIPEIVAKGILPKVSKDLDIPVMTVFLDEQTGKAGLQTRLEAFIDLLKAKRDSLREETA